VTGGSFQPLPSRRTARELLATAAVFLIVIVAAIGTAANQRAAATEQARQRFEQSAQQTAVAMEREVGTYLEKLRDVGAFMASAPNPTPAQFEQYVKDTKLFEQHPAVVGAFYLVRTPAEEFPAFKKAVLEREPGAFAIDLTNFGTPVAEGAPHYTLTHYQAGAIDLQFPRYTDVTPMSSLTEIIEAAGERGEGAAGSFQNDPLIKRVAELSDFPLIEGLKNVDFFLGLPVFGPNLADGSRPLEPIGWIGAPVDNFDSVVTAAAEDLPTGIGLQLTIDLTEVTGVDRKDLARVAEQRGTAGPSEAATFTRNGEFALEGIGWRLRIWSPPDADPLPATVPLVLAGGFVASTLVAALLYLRLRARDQERLHAAEIAEREEFQGEILDSVSTPMVVLDASGNVLRTNPAWEALVGSIDTTDEYLSVMRRFIRPTGDADRALADALWQVLRGEEASTETDVAFEDTVRRHWFTVRATRLQGRRGGAVVVHTDITERKRSHEDLEMKATRDDLTGLLNRMAFGLELESAIRAARTQESYVAAIFIDLDGFKPINDTFGHSAGDHVLREVARRISSAVRTSDRVARLGGDEFVVLVGPLADPALADTTANRILAALDRPITLDDGTVTSSVLASIGVAVSHSPLEASADDLLDRADQAMYQSKQSGGARVTVAR